MERKIKCKKEAANTKKAHPRAVKLGRLSGGIQGLGLRAPLLQILSMSRPLRGRFAGAHGGKKNHGCIAAMGLLCTR